MAALSAGKLAERWCEMLGRSKTKPSQARAKAMAQRYRGVKTSSKQPATSTVAAKPSPKPVQPPKSASPVLTREQKYQQAQKFGNAEYLNKPEVRRANNELYKNIENMVTPQMPSMGQNLPQVGAQSPMGKPPMQAGGAGGLMNQAGPMGMKKGGAVKTFKKGGSVDGCAQRGKTKGRYI